MKILQWLRTYDQKRDLALVSVGGIRSGKDAIERVKAGADLVQIYTPLFTVGP